MKHAKRLWAALLALVLLAGCGYPRTEPLPYPEPLIFANRYLIWR